MRFGVAMGVGEGGRTGDKFAGSASMISDIREGRCVAGWIMKCILRVGTGRNDLAQRPGHTEGEDRANTERLERGGVRSRGDRRQAGGVS
jgi:hypothetical protein